MVFLSATLPNAREFVEWIAYVHGSLCHVVYTEFRPTPLVHYAFPMGGSGLYLLVDEQGRFRADNFAKVREVLDSASDSAKGATPDLAGGRPGVSPAGPPSGGPPRGGRGGRTRSGGERKPQGPSPDKELEKIVRLIKERGMGPVIVFSFSRRCAEIDK
jgi:ATP-dependent RNA helicase DOB1